MTRKFITCSIIFALIISCSASFAETVIKISHQGPANPETNIQNYFVKEFTDRVTSKTDGSLKCYRLKSVGYLMTESHILG